MPRHIIERHLAFYLLLPLLASCSALPRYSPSLATPQGAKSNSRKPNQAGLSYVVFGRRYHILSHATGYHKRGIASWYGPNFHGKLTSSGAPYNMYAMSAANKVLPLYTWVKVTNLKNGKSAVVQINDRGPFVDNRIIDLSYAAAKAIGMARAGTALVEIQALTPPSREPPVGLARRIRQATPVPIRPHPRLYVQLGAFAKRINAEQLQARLLLNQVGRIKISPMRDGKHRLYRVLIGPLGGVDAIDTLTARLKRMGYDKTAIIIR